MDERYERQLAEIAERTPRAPCQVALIPTIALDQAAALANDVAQSIGEARHGHTILTSFEPAPARLDHEIGVEEGPGLSDVLAKRATLREVAALGRARGFIYVPAGAAAAPGEALLESDEWRVLVANAKRRGGTILSFIPSHILEAIVQSSTYGPGPQFDALIWLGSSRGEREGVRRAAIASGAVDIGGLIPPGGKLEPPPVLTATPPSPRRAKVPLEQAVPVGSPSRSPLLVLPSSRIARRRTAARRAEIFARWVFVFLVALLGAAIVYFSVLSSPSPREEEPRVQFAAPDER